jgi:hypothetical protein
MDRVTMDKLVNRKTPYPIVDPNPSFKTIIANLGPQEYGIIGASWLVFYNYNWFSGKLAMPVFSIF